MSPQSIGCTPMPYYSIPALGGAHVWRPVHHHLVPGEGAIDFAATLDAIHAINYDGWVTIELYPYVDDPDAAARTAFERVTRILSRNPQR